MQGLPVSQARTVSPVVPLGALPGHQQRRHVPVDEVGGQHGDLVPPV